MNIARLNVKYECQHPSCQVFCIKGNIELDKNSFNELSAEFEEEGIFKSPSGSCRMGYKQSFKAVAITEVAANEEFVSSTLKLSENDPIRVLMDEHEGVLAKLKVVEAQVKTRDINALWVSTCELENDIILHSLKKEETGFFPAIKDKIPMGPSLVGIMNEDHLEFISLLHGFRVCLQDDDILDGILLSLVANLRNHISKENEEFFPLIAEHITEKEKVEILKVMADIEKEHVPLKPGDRLKKELAAHSGDRERIKAEIASLKVVSSIGGEEMCCGGHTS